MFLIPCVYSLFSFFFCEFSGSEDTFIETIDGGLAQSDIAAGLAKLAQQRERLKLIAHSGFILWNKALGKSANNRKASFIRLFHRLHHHRNTQYPSN